jgi:hypothetical protein
MTGHPGVLPSSAHQELLPGWLAVVVLFGSLLAALTHGPVQRQINAAQAQQRT